MRKFTTISACVLTAAIAVGGLAVAAEARDTGSPAAAAEHRSTNAVSPATSTGQQQAPATGRIDRGSAAAQSATAPEGMTPSAALSDRDPGRDESSTVPLSASEYNGQRRVADTSVSCDGYLHTVDLDVAVAPLDGFSSQSAAFRVYVYSYTTGAGTWLDWNLIPAPGEIISFHSLGFDLGTNHYAIYMAYSWFNGSAWTAPVGAWVDTYTHKDLFGYWDEGFCEA